MRDFEDFFPHVMPSAPGCPEPTAIHALRQSAIEFCYRTRLWRSDDEFQVSPGESDIVCVPADAQLLEIEHATFNGVPLTQTSINELDREWPRWREDAQQTMPKYFTQTAIDTVRLVPPATGILKVYTILMPSEDAEMTPRWLLDKFARIIADGALKDILILPGQPFFNPDLAATFHSRFYRALDTHSSLNVRGQQRAPLRSFPQYL